MQVHVNRTPTLVEDASRFILDTARESIRAGGLFRLGLAGGNTPRSVYARIAEQAGDLPWERVQITFGDERCVPPHDKESNYRMASESLLRHITIPEGNIFRLRGEIEPEEAARLYEEQLATFAARLGESRYVHDLLLLGIGEDGHTASLFPGSLALDETIRSIVPATGPKPPPQRLTFTFPLINSARRVCFLTNATGKEEVIERVLAGDERYPSARVKPVGGMATWYIGEPLEAK